MHLQLLLCLSLNIEISILNLFFLSWINLETPILGIVSNLQLGISGAGQSANLMTGNHGPSLMSRPPALSRGPPRLAGPGAASGPPRLAGPGATGPPALVGGPRLSRGPPRLAGPGAAAGGPPALQRFSSPPPAMQQFSSPPPYGIGQVN